jgi:hypothetical protein
MAAGNPPEVKLQAERAKSTFKTFKEWLADREAAESEEDAVAERPHRFPTFREWLAEKAKD